MTATGDNGRAPPSVDLLDAALKLYPTILSTGVAHDAAIDQSLVLAAKFIARALVFQWPQEVTRQVVHQPPPHHQPAPQFPLHQPGATSLDYTIVSQGANPGLRPPYCEQEPTGPGRAAVPLPHTPARDQ